MRKPNLRYACVALKTFLVLGLLAMVPIPLSAGTIDQFASTVIDFSSQYSRVNWGAIQALGPSNVPSAGENRRAWAPSPRDGTLEFISLGFATPVYANGVTIRETMAAGFVYQVDLLDMAGAWNTIWAGIDPSTRYPSSWWWLKDENGQVLAQAANFLVSFDSTPYLVAGVRIRVDTNTNLSVWEEIDSVQLHGVVPEPTGSLILLVIGVLSVAGYRLFQKP
jgi:hypothetical protein